MGNSTAMCDATAGAPMEVALPASKSISARALIINALAGGHCHVENPAECDDTRVLAGALASVAKGGDGTCTGHFDIGHAGTAMRFLTAFLAHTPGTWELSGSPRMHSRPIAPLVDALAHLGARIEYLGTPGFPPLRIHGAPLAGGELSIPASLSSQYVSALMMVAPCMREGLAIRLEGKVVSAPYISMTAGVMRAFGACAGWEGGTLRISPGVPAYSRAVPYRIEADWTAASYFYALLAVARRGTLLLRGLRPGSLQGDAAQASLWERLGVCTRFTPEGALVSFVPASGTALARSQSLEYDFTPMPDLVPTFAVACCLLGIPFAFTGVDTLCHKECDRLAALAAELAVLGYPLQTEDKKGRRCLCWDGPRHLSAAHTPGTCCLSPSDGLRPIPSIKTYDDHRMAMAFAPARFHIPYLRILDPGVVSKSFPDFWKVFDRCLAAVGGTVVHPVSTMTQPEGG